MYRDGACAGLLHACSEWDDEAGYEAGAAEIFGPGTILSEAGIKILARISSSLGHE